MRVLFKFIFDSTSTLNIVPPNETTYDNMPTEGLPSIFATSADINLFSLLPRHSEKWVNMDWGGILVILDSDGTSGGTKVTGSFQGKFYVHLSNGHYVCDIAISSPTQSSIELQMSCSGKVTLKKLLAQKTSDFALLVTYTIIPTMTSDWNVVANSNWQISVTRAKTAFGFSLRGFVENILSDEKVLARVLFQQ